MDSPWIARPPTITRRAQIKSLVPCWSSPSPSPSLSSLSPLSLSLSGKLSPPSGKCSLVFSRENFPRFFEKKFRLKPWFFHTWVGGEARKAPKVLFSTLDRGFLLSLVQHEGTCVVQCVLQGGVGTARVLRFLRFYLLSPSFSLFFSHSFGWSPQVPSGS